MPHLLPFTQTGESAFPPSLTSKAVDLFRGEKKRERDRIRIPRRRSPHFTLIIQDVLGQLARWVDLPGRKYAPSSNNQAEEYLADLPSPRRCEEVDPV